MSKLKSSRYTPKDAVYFLVSTHSVLLYEAETLLVLLSYPFGTYFVH